MLNVIKLSVKTRHDRQTALSSSSNSGKPECHTRAWTVARVNGCSWGLWWQESNRLSTLPFKQQSYKKTHLKPDLNQRKDNSVLCTNILVTVTERLFHTSVFQQFFSLRCMLLTAILYLVSDLRWNNYRGAWGFWVGLCQCSTPHRTGFMVLLYLSEDITSSLRKSHRVLAFLPVAGLKDTWENSLYWP